MVAVATPSPEIYIDTMTQTPDDSLRRILVRLGELGHIETPPARRLAHRRAARR